MRLAQSKTDDAGGPADAWACLVSGGRKLVQILHKLHHGHGGEGDGKRNIQGEK